MDKRFAYLLLLCIILQQVFTFPTNGENNLTFFFALEEFIDIYYLYL